MTVQSAYNINAERAKTNSAVRISPRVTQLRDSYLATPTFVCGERSHLFTEYWKRSEGEPITIRRAKAFEYLLQRKRLSIYDEELIVGSQTRYRRGGSL